MALVFKELYELNTILQYPLNNDTLISYSKSLIEIDPTFEVKTLRFVVYLFKFKVLEFDKGNCIRDILNALKCAKELKEWLKAFNLNHVNLETSIKYYQFLSKSRQIIYNNDEQRNFKIQTYNINQYFRRIANQTTTTIS